jgi:hypothetical protein
MVIIFSLLLIRFIFKDSFIIITLKPTASTKYSLITLEVLLELPADKDQTIKLENAKIDVFTGKHVPKTKRNP